ncbi:MAG TPA: hypothetical protein PLD20_10040 [Blastocatellia bacterium]|nr:hypothetical protein [Blastocatellia bacterium]HMV81889.1 hypothetical protein [Blastocatellia bacterium]HMX25422.1 hypothetical protein [Blastocatellia bacterium]HMY76267.1 hypothetical protein [Blastocatellia bacterium]HMZ18259.1 hypothetical protein [Blastocatellia bacterium]
MNEEILKKLFAAMHAAVSEAATSTVNALANPESEFLVTYPPGQVLTAEEIQELKQLKLSPSARSGLAKLLKDACASPLFELLYLIDGVADPNLDNNEHWPGIRLELKDADESLMLHDYLYESYWLSQNRSTE